MKNVLLLFLTLTILLFSTGCSKKTDFSNNNSSSQNTLISFKSANINMADDFIEIFCTDNRASDYLIFGKHESGEYSIYITDAKFTEKKAVAFTPQNGETVKTAALMKYGKLAVLTTLNNDSIIYTFDKDGSIENTFNIGEVINTDDYFVELLCTEDGFYINVNRNSLVYIDSNGKLKGEVNCDNLTICGIINDNNDIPCVLMSENTKMTLGSLYNGSVIEKTNCGELADYTNTICTGNDNYRIVVTASGGLYGLIDNTWERITDFSENDFRIQNIIDMAMISNEEFVVLLNIYEKNKYEMRFLSQLDISEIKQKKIINVALTHRGDGDPYTSYIKKFNSENTDYKVEFVDYYNGNPEELYNQLKLDIISGKCPDIILFSEYMNVESFGSRESAFVDFYNLIDNDAELKRSDFVDGFLECLETNGKLLQITPTFTISTNIIKDKFLNGKTSWNIDEFKDIYNNMPDEMELSLSSQLYSKADIFNELVGYEQFVDKRNLECHFDSDEFVKSVGLINNLDIGIGANEAPIGITGIGEFDIINSLHNDKVLIFNAKIRSFHDMKIYQQVYAGENSTFIGYVSDEKIKGYSCPSQTFGIMANSPNIDGAWNFLKYYMFGEESLSDPHFQGFGGLKSVFEKQLVDECTDHTITDETGKKIYEKYNIPNSNEEIILKPFTKQESDKNEKFVYEALKHHAYEDSVIKNILVEELNSYFEGEKSLEDVSNQIQDRVSIYLSEKS